MRMQSARITRHTLFRNKKSAHRLEVRLGARSLPEGAASRIARATFKLQSVTLPPIATIALVLVVHERAARSVLHELRERRLQVLESHLDFAAILVVLSSAPDVDAFEQVARLLHEPV